MCILPSRNKIGLNQGTNTTYEQPNADIVIIDDATLINVCLSKQVQNSKKSDGYVAEVIVPHTESYA